MKKRRSEWAAAVICLGAIALLLACTLLIFRNFRDSLISLQENNMMATAGTVANSLQNFYDGQLTEFSMYFQDGAGQEKVGSYCTGKQEISFVCEADEQGNVLAFSGTDYRDRVKQELEAYADYAAAEGTREARLLPPVLTAQNHYTQFLVAPVGGDGSCLAVAAIEMETVYERIVEPVKIGRYGYSMVKNFEGVILMHRSRRQVGLDAVEGRRESYSEYDLDFSDLEVWVEEQQTNPSGSRILKSYWWEDDGEPVESLKVVAYTQEQIGEEIWIINCTLDYNELLLPIERAQRYVMVVAALLLLAAVGMAAFIFSSAGRRRVMEMEVKHLKEMNTAWEELHRREEQIRHKDRMQTLGTMTSMISHEFNNFLTPIMLYGDMLAADTDISPENRAMAAEITAAAGRARDLTAELSRYGRSGQGTRKKTLVHISEEAAHSVKLFKKVLPENIRMEAQLDPDAGFGMLAGAGTINQIIVNLCKNAAQAMEQTGGVISVRGRFLEDGETKRYALTVSDNGPGMSAETLDQIFTPFFTTKKQGEGTGLGLAIVQGLVHEASGEISAVSAPGQGTRFDILLPVFKIEEMQKKPVGRDALASCSVLVLDDDEKVGEALGRAVKPLCRKVRVFSRPEAALSEMKKHLADWDLLLTDYKMPVMSGLEFAGILRGHGYAGKIFLVSGNLDRDTEWYLNQGIIDAVLAKPVSVEDIAEAFAKPQVQDGCA